MSLEDALATNTAAMVELTRVLMLGSGVRTEQTVTSKESVPNEKPATTPTSGAPSAPTPALSSAALTYKDDVQPLVLAMSKQDRSKTIATLQRFGVSTAKSLTEFQWPEFVAYAKRVLAGEVDPEAAS